MQLQQVPGLAQRMAALMCVDLDLSSDSKVVVDESSGKHENAGKGNAMQVVEREMHKSQEEGYGASTWLELDELDIDDDMLISLDLSSKFPVCHSLLPRID